MTARLAWIASYPRSGNTWLRALITAHRNPDLSSPLDDLVATISAADRDMLDRVMGFDTADLLPAEVEALRPEAYGRLNRAATGPVYLKIHDACITVPGGAPLFPPAATAGAVYVVRDPRDVCVSLAHFGPGRSIDRAIDILLDPEFCVARSTGARGDTVTQRLGTWPDHVRSWTQAVGYPVQVVRYEDLLERPIVTLESLFAFLGLPIGSAAISRTVDACRFDRLSGREAEKGYTEAPAGPTQFFRSGRHGGWRQTLSDAQTTRIVDQCGDVMSALGYL